MGSSKPQPTGSPPESTTERLDSWKEIAAYLLRDERTVVSLATRPVLFALARMLGDHARADEQ